MIKDIPIGRHVVGPSRPIYFVVDIAANHDGDLERAKDLIHRAALVLECAARGLKGTYNLGSRDGLSKAAFGFAVARRLGLDTACVMIGASAADPARAPRALDLRLDMRRIEAALARTMPTLEAEIDRLIEAPPKRRTAEGA